MQAMTTAVSALISQQASIEAQVRKKFPAMTFGPERIPVSEEARMQAARRLREALCSVPFYAKAAERASQRGDEMDYWLQLKASEPMLHRP